MPAKHGKKKSKRPALSPLAKGLLQEMAKSPQRLEYITRVLGGAFEDSDVERLDEAYRELLRAGLAEDTGIVVSFFGAPKSIARITKDGLAQAARVAP